MAMVIRTALFFFLLTAPLLRAGSIPFTQIQPLTQRYTLRSWNVHKGLPENQIRALAFDARGFLWILTPHRLARFDGLCFDEPLSLPVLKGPGSTFQGLFFDAHQTLWVYGSEGAWRQSSKGWSGLWSQNPPAILKLAQGPAGVIWMVSARHLYAWDHEKLTDYPCPATLPATSPLADLAIDPQGHPWLAASDRLLRFGQGQWTLEFQPPVEPSHQPAVWKVTAGATGRIWTASRTDLFYRDAQTWQVFPTLAFHGSYMLPGEVLQTPTGELWVASHHSIAVYQEGQWWRFYEGKELPFPMICQAMARDASGHIWVGTDGGLVRISPRLVRVVPATPSELTHRAVVATWVKENRELWVGFQGGDILAGNNQSLHLPPSQLRLPQISATTFFKDAKGYLWIGSQGKYLWRAKDGQFKWVADFRSPEAPRAYRTSAFCQTPDTTFWAGTNDGLMRCGDPYGQAWFAPGGGPQSPVTALEVLPEGSLWIGYESAGVALRSPKGDLQRFVESDGLPGPGVFALYQDAEGVLWLGGRRGLARWQGRQHWVVPPELGLGGLPITQIVEDDHQHLWLGTPDGIWRVSKAELSARSVSIQPSGRLHARRLGVDEGMPLAECTGSLVYDPRRSASRPQLWFGTAGGLVTLEPAKMPAAGPPPEIHLLAVSVAGRELWCAPAVGSDELAELKLPAGASQVVITFTGLKDAALEQLRFSYRLGGPGVKSPWSALSPQRSALFEYLPAGGHEFELIAVSSSGAWNETGVRLRLKVEPWFWQTGWFLTLMVLLCGLLVGLVVRRVMRRRFEIRLEKIRQLEVLQKERTRIARDLHDDLGAGLTQVAILSDLARGELSPADAGQLQRLEEIFHSARGMAQSLDEIVWAINPANDLAENFIVYLAQYAEGFLHAAGIALRLRLPAESEPMVVSSPVRHHLFMAVKEALTNVVKHAQATEVELSVSLTDGLLSVCVRDNGRGLPAQSPRVAAGQDGTENLTARMREIGGRLERTSSAQGTELMFRVPVR